MSYPSWPASLPQVFRRDGYQENPEDTVLRTEMDIGPAKLRRKSTTENDRISGTMLLTKTQWLTVRTFYKTTLARVLPFTWVHPSTGASANFRFVAPPSVGPGGGSMVIMSMSLEVVS